MNSLFMVWEQDDINSSFYEDTDDPKPLYVAMLCHDCSADEADVIRGYSPVDGIFERPGVVVESLGGCEIGDHDYRRTIEHELRAEFAARAESMIERGTN